MMAYALDYVPGKLWVAEQIEFISSRYLPQSSRKVVRRVRDAIMNDDPSSLTRANPSATIDSPISNPQDWAATPSSSTAQDIPQYNLAEDRMAPTAAGTGGGLKIKTEGTLESIPNETQGWNELL